MKTALIGYTGLVGSHLNRQLVCHGKYNRKNIEEIRGKQYDLIICAGMYGTKWYANKFPEEDLEAIYQLINSLKGVNCGYLVLMSTVDVYKYPVAVDEDTTVDTDGLHSYGKHRYMVETFVREHFEQHLIVRLPALFGQGLKKNFLYDLIHDQCLHWTHKDSQYQYYNLAYLWQDVQRAMKAGISLLHVNSEPITARELAQVCFQKDFLNETDAKPMLYDVRSRYVKHDGHSPYMYSKNHVMADIKRFIKEIG
ncbi:NAD(P)-dependent oxidoreductase [Vallitalea pronyensis]|uniref:NAD(P)-dependent oxidoreductase n=1 Tax=Vallitalea pronyensis TaxID=1348613 RepID=A0A8J8SF13_9FIRM|nr:NAD(P)-dependent oxidoreductase [Vallitalea pronyensis]QUI21130.1 NAD(P)-dependent oxidoreductase [Vallitalea pronyensis]